jgi:hypothetical protein
MPYIERIIFQYALRDRCLKEILAFENKREVSQGHAKIHPKNSIEEARNLVDAFNKK